MIYVMSDLRGNYAGFLALLDKIRFNGRDTLYVLGNVIDGGDSMKLLLDMMMRQNVYPVIGDHEYAALPCLEFLQSSGADGGISGMDPDLMQRMADWTAIGGRDTIAQFRSLSEEEQEMIVDYLSDFSLYEEVKAGGRDFVLVHAGIGNFDSDKDLDEYDIYDLITLAPDYGKQYYDNKYLVTGHTPTRRIFEEQNPLIEPVPEGEPSAYDKVYTENNHVAVNCGGSIGGRLAVVRLDDMEVFYAD